MDSGFARPPKTRKSTGRRWHHRGFGGCFTCRRRHIKCDEVKPSCSKCAKVNIRCEGYGQKVTFKHYQGRVSQNAVESSKDVRPKSTQLDFLNVHPPKLSQLTCWDTTYHSYFLKTVSTILIVWDAPYNSNPYRLSFPHLAASSWSLSESMRALGALHLANTTTGEKAKIHLKHAMTSYGNLIRALKLTSSSTTPPTLQDLATNLLLCFYEVS